MAVVVEREEVETFWRAAGVDGDCNVVPFHMLLALIPALITEHPHPLAADAEYFLNLGLERSRVYSEPPVGSAIELVVTGDETEDRRFTARYQRTVELRHPDTHEVYADATVSTMIVKRRD